MRARQACFGVSASRSGSAGWAVGYGDTGNGHFSSSSKWNRRAQILILDEPTATLDARAEYEVFLRFADLTKGRTAVLISHRFSTVRMADRILVLADGAVEEQGTHAQLVALGGRYAELFELQAAGYR